MLPSVNTRNQGVIFHILVKYNFIFNIAVGVDSEMSFKMAGLARTGHERRVLLEYGNEGIAKLFIHFRVFVSWFIFHLIKF